MLRVDREDGRSVLAGQRHHEASCGHKGFLIGQGDGLAGLDGGDGGLQPAESDHRGEHDVDLRVLEQFADGVDAGKYLYIKWIESSGHFVVEVRVADDHARGVETAGLLDEQPAVVVGGEEFHLEAVFVLTDYVEGLGADRTGGAEDGNVPFRFLFH